jgi:hypothetical protein
LWFSGGVGGGWNFTGTPQNPDPRAGWGGYVRIGGTLSPYLLLGGETEWWLRDETESVRESRVNLTFSGLYYPWLDHGFYVRLGVGGAGAEFIVSGSSNTWETGWGVTLGTGYDITLGKAVSLTPNVDFLFQRVFDTNTTIVMFTLGITFP